jgi:hypothetical protein
MNAREAKQYACAYLARLAEHGADDADPSLSDADNQRVTDALEDLSEELQRRAGEWG